MNISLNELLYETDSFTGKMQTSFYFENKTKDKENEPKSPRYLAFEEFCNLFNLKLEIPKD